MCGSNSERGLINIQRCKVETLVLQLRRRAYADWEYWGRPVPSFGDAKAHVLALGLAPGVHGSNRTGRPFTGDGSGDFLFPVLHSSGFASTPTPTTRNDGMKLSGCRAVLHDETGS